MPTIPIDALASVGLIKDQPGYMLPPEAWTKAYNVRYRDGAVERLAGYSQIFGTPGVAPYFAMPLVTSSTFWWLYMGLAKAYAYDGSAHTDITRAAGGDYAATSAAQLNGTLLGGIPILNNGVDEPQAWLTASTGTDLTDLANWDSNRTCRVMRALGSFLVALNITDGSDNFGHQVLWSHPAEPGSVPSSWDETDPAKDTGLNELPDVNSGVITDAGALRGSLYIYKGSSTWRQSFIGGRFIFDFKTFSETSGILAPRCWTLTPDGLRHVVLTQDDLIIHDGNKIVSILDKKMRKTLFAAISPTTYGESFVFANPTFSEIWVCYPEQGATVANRALIWNYKEGGISEADVAFQHAAQGEFESVDTELWSDGSDTWATDTGPWGQVNRKQVVLVSPVTTKFYQMDSGLTRDGSAFTATLQRGGLSILGKDRQGNWIVDHEQYKMLKRLWPKLRGGAVRIRFGSQDLVDGPITWNTPKSFDPSLSVTHDDIVTGRANAIEIETTASAHWTLDGYKVEVEPLGSF